MYCGNCGEYNDDSMNFCTKCGTPLKQVQAVNPAAPVTDSTLTQPAPRPTPKKKGGLPIVLAGAALGVAVVAGAYFLAPVLMNNSAGQVIEATQKIHGDMVKEIDDFKGMTGVYPTHEELTELMYSYTYTDLYTLTAYIGYDEATGDVSTFTVMYCKDEDTYNKLDELRYSPDEYVDYLEDNHCLLRIDTESWTAEEISNQELMADRNDCVTYEYNADPNYGGSMWTTPLY